MYGAASHCSLDVYHRVDTNTYAVVLAYRQIVSYTMIREKTWQALYLHLIPHAS